MAATEEMDTHFSALELSAKDSWAERNIYDGYR